MDDQERWERAWRDDPYLARFVWRVYVLKTKLPVRGTRPIFVRAVELTDALQLSVKGVQKFVKLVRDFEILDEALVAGARGYARTLDTDVMLRYEWRKARAEASTVGSTIRAVLPAHRLAEQQGTLDQAVAANKAMLHLTQAHRELLSVNGSKG